MKKIHTLGDQFDQIVRGRIHADDFGQPQGIPDPGRSCGEFRQSRRSTAIILE